MSGCVTPSRSEALGRRLGWKRSICAAELYPKSGCRSCMDACTLKALRIQGDESGVEESCDGCGACIPACPTGALDLPRKQDAAELEAEIRRKLAMSPGCDILFACERCKPPAEAISIPCAARLDESLLLYGPVRGAGGVRILLGDCRACDRTDRLMKVLGGVLGAARAVLDACELGRDLLWIGRSDALKEQATKDGREVADRRGFFRRVAQAALTPVGSGSSNGNGTAPGRRLRLVQELRAAGKRTSGGETKNLTMGRIRISDDCYGCPVCAHVCASHAITREQSPEGNVEIRFEPALCDGCGVCVDACMPKAMTLEKMGDLRALASRARLTLMKLADRTCPTCRVPFHSAREVLCPRCRKASIHGGLVRDIGNRLRPAEPKA